MSRPAGGTGRPRPARDYQRPSGPKEHPQYGTRIPPEELEAMKDLQRQQGQKSRGARYDDTRRPRNHYERPTTPGGGFRREGGPSGPTGPRSRPGSSPRPSSGPRSDRPSRPTRFERPAREGGFGGQGYRPTGGPRPDRGPRPTGSRFSGPRPEGGFRPDRDRGPRPDRFERKDRFEPRSDRPARPARFETPVRSDVPVRHERTERPMRPVRSDVPKRPLPSSAGLGPPKPVPAPETPPLTRFRMLLQGFQSTAALMAGYSLGVFSEIHRRPQTAEDLAKACASDPHGLRALLEALVALGALQRHGPTYVLPRDMAPYLVPGVDGDATGQIDMTMDLYHAWGELARGVRDGSPLYPLTGDEILHGDPSRVRRYIRAVHTGSREAAYRLVQMAPLLPGSSLLDVGGGSGIYSATYARQTPDLKAHLFDLAPTLEVARDILHAEGMSEQIEYHAGDYRHDPFPGPVDTVLLSNVIQTESEEHAFGILKRSWEALRPGGTLLIHGTMPDADAPPHPPVALFSLLMFTLFGHGKAWSSDQVSEWLAQERFGVRSVKPLGEPFHSKLIVATRLD